MLIRAAMYVSNHLFARVKILKVFVVTLTLLSLVYYLISLTISKEWTVKNTNKTAPLSLRYVVVHIDFKGSPPKLEYLKTLLPILRMHGVNALLLEYEDMFPYDKKLVNISAEYCYSKAELQSFLAEAVKLEFELIPLIQTFGHLEHALKLSEFRDLREKSQYPDSICPSNQQSVTLIADMLEQVINFHKEIAPLKHIHIGCDEVFSINSCGRCKARNLEKIDIFLLHVETVSRIIETLSPQTYILIWDDMLRGISPQIWTEIDNANNIEIVYWDYNSKVKATHVNLRQYHRTFNNIWISSAYKGADGSTATFPNIKNRYMNHFSWLNFILNYRFGGEDDNFDFKGIILTGWSRYSHFDAACELLPITFPSLILNLLLIDTFKNVHSLPAVRRSSDKYYKKYLRTALTNYLQCQKPVSLDNYDFSQCYNVDELYKVLKHCANINDFISYTFDNNSTGLYSYEYYSEIDSINLNKISKNIIWCKIRLKELAELRDDMMNAMSPYYENVFINEYIEFKTYNSKRRVQNLLRILRNFSKIRSWKRRSFNNKTAELELLFKENRMLPNTIFL